jgi:hypothetical protein
METIFFERVKANHYVFSGNGENGNPERKTLEMLLDARGNDDFAIHLTYPISEIDTARKADWNKQRDKEVAKKKKKPNTKVRGNVVGRKAQSSQLLYQQQSVRQKVSNLLKRTNPCHRLTRLNLDFSVLWIFADPIVSAKGLSLIHDHDRECKITAKCRPIASC